MVLVVLLMVRLVVPLTPGVKMMLLGAMQPASEVTKSSDVKEEFCPAASGPSPWMT